MILELTRADAIDPREFANAHLRALVAVARAKIEARGTRELPPRHRNGRFAGKMEIDG